MYPDGGCYDPLRTVLGLHRSDEWIDVFGAACGVGLCSSGDAGPEAQRGKAECTCPDTGLVKLEPGAKLVVGPLTTQFLRPGIERPPPPDVPASEADGGVSPSSTASECTAQRPLPAGAYQLEVDAMSGIDPYCGASCDCVSDASGACVTKAQAGDGEVLTMVLTMVQTVELPDCNVVFAFRDQ